MLATQEGRCQAWTDRLNAAAKKGLNRDKEQHYDTLNKAEHKKVRGHLNDDMNDERELNDDMLETHHPPG